MSVYQVNKLLYLTDNDAAFRKRMQEDPETVLNEFQLTKEERDALTSGAVGKLYQMGVHTFLLNHLYRWELFGVNRDNYLIGFAKVCLTIRASSKATCRSNDSSKNDFAVQAML
jgi:hypothetical protein